MDDHICNISRIMDSNSSRIEQITPDELIEEFKQKMLDTFGLRLTVSKAKDNPINPHLLLEAANDILKGYGAEFYSGMDSTSRRRPLVYLRAAYAKVCSEDGMPNAVIARYIGMHRCTVIHSLKVARDLLATKNMEFTKVYNTLITKYYDIHSKNQREQDIPIR